MFFVWLRQQVAKLFWAVSGWRLVKEEPPVTGSRILIGAPHTSNFDFILMLGIAWEAKMRVRWLGKKELFKGPAGWIMRALGGIAVDRKDPGNIVQEVLKTATGDERFLLVVTPEGTRSGKGWRSGFYRIAYTGNLPVTLGFADGSTKSSGFGPTLNLTGNVEADMQIIRSFYKNISGVRPHLKTEPRLSDEAGLTKLLAGK